MHRIYAYSSEINKVNAYVSVSWVKEQSITNTLEVSLHCVLPQRDPVSDFMSIPLSNILSVFKKLSRKYKSSYVRKSPLLDEGFQKISWTVFVDHCCD